MSKIGKKNIILPKESSIKIDGSNLTITGPKGSCTMSVSDKIFSSMVNDNKKLSFCGQLFTILNLQTDIQCIKLCF